VTATSIERLNGHDRGFDPVALAEAEAIRTRAAAEAEAARIKAEGRAEAERIKAAEEARKQKIVNDKAEARAREEQAAREARIAKLNREREEEERAAREAEEKAAVQEQAEESKAKEIAAAEEQWRQYALRFYAVCSIVALPVQIAAFYNPKALWLMAAPLMLEGGAWVVLKGARAAAADRRPHWHYRLIAWVLAFIAASINLWHGLHAFDPATAIGTAFASIAGPGVYDLHEHGQIRKRDGSLTRKQRKAQAKADRAETVRKAAEEKRLAAEKEAAKRATAEAAEKLAQARAKEFPKVWQHALRLAAALGETTVTEAVWKRAHRDVEGADPSESAEIIRLRNAAEARVEAARQKRPVNGSTQQVASQVPGAKKPRVYNPPARRGRRTKGDVKYAPAARRQAAITAKQTAARKDAS
jgi:hypothetical protein